VETQGLSGACPWFPWAIASINSVSFRTGDMASAKATAALALCAVVTRVLLAFFGWHDVLSSRVELTSPVDSIRRLKEGTALVALRMSPYHGSVVHAPPLVLFLLAPVLDYAEGMNNASVKAIVTIAPFLLADLFAAAALFSLAKRFDASLVVKRKDLDTKETLVQTSNPALVQKTNPALCVSLYLANPMTIASCVAGSSAGLGTACVVTACAAAAGGDPVIAGACCAGAAYLTGAPGVLLLYPIASLAAGNGIAKTTLEVSAGGSAVGGRESSGTPNKRFLATLVSFAVTCSILVPLSTAAFSEVGTTTTQWLTGTYIFTFRVADLTPNLGIYWYMFAELFPHFRGLFRCAFHGFAAFLCAPLFVRHAKRKPLLCVTVTMAVTTILGPYPTLGQVGGYLCLVPLGAVTPSQNSQNFLVAGVFVAVALLSPILWHLWIHARVANANFFFAVTLGHFAAQSFLVVGWLRSAAAKCGGGFIGEDGEGESKKKR